MLLILLWVSTDLDIRKYWKINSNFTPRAISQTNGLSQAQTAVGDPLRQAAQTTSRRYLNLSVAPIATPKWDLGVGC